MGDPINLDDNLTVDGWATRALEIAVAAKVPGHRGGVGLPTVYDHPTDGSLVLVVISRRDLDGIAPRVTD